PVEICFLLPSMKDPTAEFSYATPVSQHAPLGLMTVQYTNRSGADQADVRFKADVVDPAGTVTSFTTTVDLMPAGTADTLINFDEYDVPAVEGKYKVIYSNNKYTKSRDTLVREFVMTRYTYATDNLKPSGSVGPSDQQFLDAGFKYQTAGMVVTGPNGITVERASFGMGNASAIAVGDPAADIVNVLLYDNDANDDGQADLDAGFSDLFPVAFADYQFSKEKADSLVYPKLESLAGEPEVTLKPDHLYMISILYDGNAAGLGKSLSFTRSSQVPYPQFVGIGLHTPLLLDDLYSGWGGATVVTRLHEKGFNPGNDPYLVSSTKNVRLPETKFNVTPNPANDIVRLNLDLEGVNPSVAATLLDFQGRAVSTQVVRNFQQGQITFDAAKLPSGAYTLWIRTSNEGSTMAKLMICH
ncbi:MAG TPA: T9SS type A sorting domain-containing protein, partial [Saprospiraceae bacterium]|nr:T9SS type A sorting domain-containing protein [Saprospiraceae bacterium]